MTFPLWVPLWVPLGIMGAALVLAELDKLTSAKPGMFSTALGVVFATAFLAFLAMVFLTVDMLALAEGAKAAVLNGWAENPRLVTTLLLGLGFVLSFGGMGRAAGRVVEADPQGPLISLFTPVAAALLGFVLLALGYARI